MLKINCLLAHTDVIDDMKAAVEMIAMERAAAGRKATLDVVYNDIRSAGIEVDLRTTALMYSEVLPDNAEFFSSMDEIDQVIGKDVSDTIRKIVLNEPVSGEQQIGKMSPEEHVANGIANVFYNQIKTGKKTDSVAKTLQDAMLRGAKRLLKDVSGAKTPETKEGYRDIIQRALGLESKGLTDINGKLNGIRDLFAATQEELKKISGAIEDSDDYALQEQWQEYLNGFEEAAYSLLFSKQEAKDVLTGIMKDAGFGKTTKDGKVLLDWVRLAGEINDVDALRRNIIDTLVKNGLEETTADRVADALQQEYYEFRGRILEKARGELDNRMARIEDVREPMLIKSDFKKLAELNALGAFDNNYNKLLFRTLGVPELEAEDILEIQNIAKNAATLSAEMDGKDYLAGYAFQAMQRDINKIVARSITNKTKNLKVIGAIDKYFQFLNMGRIANAYNMLENNLSGFRELLATNIRIMQQQGVAEAFKDRALFKAVWRDVLKGGVGYGEELHRFSSKEYINDLYNKVDFKNAESKKEYLQSLVALVSTPARAFLSASDSAFKAAMHRKAMQLALHRALMQQGMSKQEANRYLNEALYGQSYADAENKATQLLGKYGLPVNKNSVARLANDLVVGNLNTDGYISADLVEAAFKSGYKIAGIGLGHLSQESNVLAKRIEAHKRMASLEEQRLIKEERWDELAQQRLQNSILYGMISPFVSGILNWIQLRIQSGLGMGIVTGYLGDWKSDIDFDSKRSMEHTIAKVENKRQQIARGITGLTYNAVLFSILAAVAYSMDDEDEEKSAIVELFDKMRGDYFSNKIFLRSAPDFVLLSYLFSTEKTAGNAPLKYFSQFFNLGSEYATNVQLVRVGDLLARGDVQQAKGKAAAILGSKIEVPLWRSYKGFYQLVRGVADEDYKPEWKPPFTIAEGLVGGGMFEDIGLFRRDSPIEALPGIGPKTKEKMNKAGIYKVSDISRNPRWASYIPQGQRKKAQQAYEELYAE